MKDFISIVKLDI